MGLSYFRGSRGVDDGRGSISSGVFTDALCDVRLASTRKRGFLLRSLIYCCLLTAACALQSGVMRADTITLTPGSSLTVDFSLPGFDPSNPGALFPTTIGLDLVGAVPSGSTASPIPGSSQTYFSGIMLDASLKSLDGTVSLPLFDADSWRLGFATGTLVADSMGGNSAIAAAQVAVSLNESEAIFGATGQAEFVINDVSGVFVIGLGPGYSLQNAILAPLTADNGGVSTSGYVQGLQMSPAAVSSDALPIPEPASLGIAAAGGAALFWLRRRLRP
jgi:PEP-CTERM motif